MKLFSFIPEFITQDYNGMMIKGLIVTFVWLLVAIMIALDLYAGVGKAKQAGEMRSSEGYRRTTKKIKEYYMVMICALIFDCFVSIITYYLPFPMPYIPIMTLGIGFWHCFVEFRSIQEKADDKHRRKMNEGLTDLVQIINTVKTTNPEIVETILENFKSKSNTKNDGQELH